MPDFSAEISFKTTRSGGKGGQNVNKVETAVEALWPVVVSSFFNDEEKEHIISKLSNRINKEGCLVVKSTLTRTQLGNKEDAVQKMQALVAQALMKPKLRKKSKPSKGAMLRRLESKRKESEKKEMRRRDW